jgi:8-oxo-dGTP pyrophosphatase MutT (NUDIX family)
MITKEILGANRLKHPTKERIGCRGIIILHSKILLIHGLEADFFMLPGGGQEPGETLENCCIRELQEETGYVVTPCKEGAFLELNEYYEEFHYTNYFYTCEIIGTASKSLTEVEVKRKLVPEWLDLKVAIDVFSRHQDFASSSEIKMRAYLRDYTALQSMQ